mmetsp:Transcript_25662/g.51794  ORF Transcript_25662/g.51794 Transcript_25662/m.51794 type:complete len:316 (+) Transcript_25662:827-1774(+)
MVHTVVTGPMRQQLLTAVHQIDVDLGDLPPRLVHAVDHPVAPRVPGHEEEVGHLRVLRQAGALADPLRHHCLQTPLPLLAVQRPPGHVPDGVDENPQACAVAAVPRLEAQQARVDHQVGGVDVPARGLRRPTVRREAPQQPLKVVEGRPRLAGPVVVVDGAQSDEQDHREAESAVHGVLLQHVIVHDGPEELPQHTRVREVQIRPGRREHLRVRPCCRRDHRGALAGEVGLQPGVAAAAVLRLDLPPAAGQSQDGDQRGDSPHVMTSAAVVECLHRSDRRSQPRCRSSNHMRPWRFLSAGADTCPLTADIQWKSP